MKKNDFDEWTCFERDDICDSEDKQKEGQINSDDIDCLRTQFLSRGMAPKCYLSEGASRNSTADHWIFVH